MSEPRIQVEHVYKEFRIYHRHHATIKEAVVNRLRGRTGRYDPFWALRDVTLSVADGEVLGIIGPNGAGKSTLLSIMAGILQPTYGTVTVRGSYAALMGLGVGLDVRLTGRENVFLYGSVLGLPRRAMAERMDEIMDFAELGEFADAPVRTYSSGMSARLAFSVAINVTPEVLLLDEVLAVGDLAFRQKCLDRMMGLRERIRTIVIIAHQMDTIREWCDHVLWLQHGVIAASGPADEVTKAYQAASLVATAHKGVFDDVPYTHSARSYIEAAYRGGVIEEAAYDPEGDVRLFAPDDVVRRRDMARYLCKAAGKQKLDSPRPRFPDVPQSDPDYGWIECLADASSWRDAESPDVTAPAQATGPEPAEFEPEREVTRGEMAALVCRALGKRPLNRGTPTFADVPPSHACYGMVERLADPGSWGEPPVVGSGGARRVFGAENRVTRAQAAVVIARAWNLLPEAESDDDDARPGDAAR